MVTVHTLRNHLDSQSRNLPTDGFGELLVGGHERVGASAGEGQLPAKMAAVSIVQKSDPGETSNRAQEKATP